MHAAVSDDLYQVQINMKYARTVTSNNQTSLMLAIQSGSLRAAKELVIIEAGFQDLDGRTALMYAVQLGSLDLVEMLAAVESGLVDSHGCTALMYAVKDNKENLASILVRTEGVFATIMETQLFISLLHLSHLHVFHVWPLLKHVFVTRTIGRR